MVALAGRRYKWSGVCDELVDFRAGLVRIGKLCFGTVFAYSKFTKIKKKCLGDLEFFLAQRQRLQSSSSSRKPKGGLTA